MSYKIRPASHSDFGFRRVQFVECDPDVQDARGTSISRNELERKLKALCLLNDVVAIGATHVLKSEDTFAVLRRNPRLISEGPIVFTMSRSHDSFEETLEQKLTNPERHNPLWTSKNPNIEKQERELRRRAKFLEHHASAVMTRDISNMREGFSQGLTFELSEDGSPLRQQVLKSGVNPDSLKDKIEQTDHSSRRFVHNNANNLPDSVYRTLKRHADINYHLTGSTFHNAATTLHPCEIAESGSIYKELTDVYSSQGRLEVSMSSPINSESDGSSMNIVGPKVPKINDALAMRMFSDIAGGIKDDISTLEAGEILDLRNQEVTKNLRRELTLISNNIHRDQVTTSNHRGVEQARQEFREALTAEYCEELDRQKWAQRVIDRPTTLGASIGMNLLGSYLLGSDEAFVGGSALTATLWAMGRYFPEFVETDLLDFEEKYRDVINN